MSWVRMDIKRLREKEKVMAETGRIPKSRTQLKRPVDKHHAFLLIEEGSVWVTSRNRELAETFSTLIMRGDSVTVAKTNGVTVWGTFAGEPDKTGTIILDRKPDTHFKLVPLSDTPKSLLTRVAHLIGHRSSLTSQEGQHGLSFRGKLRNPSEPIKTEATARVPKSKAPSAKDKASTQPVEIPKSRAGLKRPADKHHALLRIEKENAWVTSRDRELAQTFCTMVTRGDPVTVVKTTGVTVWGTYAKEPEQNGTIILDRKPDGRFKLVPLDITPNSLLTHVAHLIGRPDSVTSEEGHHGLIFRGRLRNPSDSPETETTDQEQDPEAAEAPAGEFEKVTGDDAVAAIGQKVTMEFIERGVKVRIRGNQKDCERTAKLILKGQPAVASQHGAKYMIEGNLSKSFLKKGVNQKGPDAHGICTRENSSERTFTAFGENLTAVQAACLTGCKEGTMFTIVVNDRSTGPIVISSGKKRLV